MLKAVVIDTAEVSPEADFLANFSIIQILISLIKGRKIAKTHCLFSFDANSTFVMKLYCDVIAWLKAIESKKNLSRFRSS